MNVTFQLDEEDKYRIQTQTDNHLARSANSEPDAFAIVKKEFATHRQSIIEKEIEKINDYDRAEKTHAHNNRRAVVDGIIVKINTSLDERIQSLGGKDPSETIAQVEVGTAAVKIDRVVGSRSRFVVLFLIVILTFMVITLFPKTFRWWWLRIYKAKEANTPFSPTTPQEERQETRRLTRETEEGIQRLFQIFSVDADKRTMSRRVIRFGFLVAAIAGLQVLIFFLIASQYFCDKGYVFSFRLWRERVLRGKHGIGIILIYAVCGVLLVTLYSSALVQRWVRDVYFNYVGGTYSAAVSIPAVTGFILLTMVSMNVLLQNTFVGSKRHLFVDSDGFIESGPKGVDERMSLYGCEKRKQRTN